MPARVKPQAPDTFLNKHCTEGTTSRKTSSQHCHLPGWHHSQATSSSAYRHLIGGFPCSHHCTFSLQLGLGLAGTVLLCPGFLAKKCLNSSSGRKTFPCCALVKHEATVLQQIGVHLLVIHQHAFLSYICAASH